MADQDALERVKRLASATISFDDIARSVSLDDVLEASPDGIVITDRAGRIIYTNKRTCTLFGYARGRLLGQEIEILIPERFRSKHVEHRTQYCENPEPRMMGNEQTSLYGVTSDGRELPIEISLAHANAEAGMVVILHIRKKTSGDPAKSNQ